nr:VWA domain-containing protein [Candidatus Sigynarchaeota archaeon]
MNDVIEVLISFDTTGSMFPCLAEVRKSISALIDQLFSAFGKIHIGIFAQGDYAQFGGKYLLKKLELTSDKAKLINFVQSVEQCGIQDIPEPYETVLHDARFINWEKDANKIVIIFADSYPHPANINPDRYDWKN